MYRFFKTLILIGYSLTPAIGYSGALLGYTHMLPGPLTVPGGRIQLGSQVSLGVTDFLQIDSNLIRDFYQIYNVTGKLSLIRSEDFALAALLGFESYNPKNLSSLNPDVTVTSWSPGLVLGIRVTDDFAWFLGGDVVLTRLTSLKTSGFINGTTAESDFSWAYEGSSASDQSRRSRKKSSRSSSSSSNVLSFGATYDLTYKVYGAGLSHHWRGFTLGMHYYLNATQNRLFPIISGGAVIDI